MGWARAQGTTGISGFAAPQGEGHGFDPAQGCEGMWLPTYLGSSLAAWYKADAGCYTDAACLFASASSQYLSKTSPTFAPTTKMTIRFSIKPDGFGASKAILGRFDGADNQFLVYQTGTGAVTLFVCSGATDASNYAVTTETLVDATRADVVIVYDGTLGASARVAIYINGVAATMSVTGTIPTSLRASSATLSVGAHSGASEPYNGAIARLGFSSLALSGAALTAAHTSTFWADMTAARQADWFSFYNLCEASGTRVDSTGLNNLTPTNGPTVAAGPGEGLCVDNSPCKRRNDQSGLGRDQTWATTATQPVWKSGVKNGRPALLWNGSTTRALEATFTQAQPLAVFVAAKHASGAFPGDQIITYGQADAPALYGTSTGPGWAYYAGSTGLSAGTPDALWHVHAGIFNGASSSRRLDAVEINAGNPGANGFTSYLSGDDPAGGKTWNGYSAEEFVMGGAPTATQLASAEAYLAQRWT